jgi:DNA-binding XRE family transcriptional regulator
MIQNERQYRITKTKLKEFQSSVAELKKLDPPITINEKLSYQADLDSLESFIEEFQEEIAEYETLQQGKLEQLTLESFDELPQALIKARIVRGLTQEKLAEILEVKPQQVQRDEANLYAGASFSKLLTIQKALHLEIKPKVIFQEC